MPFSQRLRMSVFLKFTGIVSICLIVILAAIGLMLIALQQRALIAERIRNAQRFTDVVARISAFHIEKFTYYMLEENTIQIQAGQGEQAQTDVVSVLVYNMRGKQLNPAGIPPEKIALPKKFWHTEERPCIFQAQGVPPKTVGKVVLVFSLEAIYQHIAQLRTSFLLILVLAIVVLDVVIGVLVSLVITRPLKLLTAAAEQIATGNYGIHLAYIANDEIGLLSRAFVKMSQDLQDSFAKITAFNKKLEQCVQERTAELAYALSEIRLLNERLNADNLRLSAELDVAQRMQRMILPRSDELQDFKDVEIVGFMNPADEVGGDYYDVLMKDDILHIGIGDVTGHGLESGVLMLMAQTAIRTLLNRGDTDPITLLSTLNQVLYENIQRMGVDKTLTLAFAYYQSGQLKIIGQHEELLIVRAGGKIERVDTIDLGFPLGLEFEIRQWVKEATVTLHSGDVAVLYTDGITEAENLENEIYGIDRLCAVLSRHWEQSAEAIKQAVIADVTQFIGAQKVFDDLTLVILKQK